MNYIESKLLTMVGSCRYHVNPTRSRGPFLFEHMDSPQSGDSSLNPQPSTSCHSRRSNGTPLFARVRTRVPEMHRGRVSTTTC
ncbi:hypothetical protein EUGRSUZ_I02011 [Eucalyptus grandis]|uniref:Uncharacterized protein n=2 Tax=Eucalyptus grandis TaxID=71139 RepID=A0ACC3JJV5_EUCGR|nr:hypothetical protein EUGRSUZ_I02011 [Eucalyptus grandis]